jgi:hypothetical protein
MQRRMKKEDLETNSGFERKKKSEEKNEEVAVF